MAKLSFFIILIFLVVLIFLALLNKGLVDLTIWNGISYQIPVIALILISAATGMLSMFIVVAIRDTRRYVNSWQIQRRQKKAAKIQHLYAKGLDAFFAGRHEEAEELFTRVIEDEPDHCDALLRLGDIFFSREEFIRAKDFYLRAGEIRPKNIEILLSLQKVSEALQKWDEAVKYIDQIMETGGENTKILYRKRDIYERNGEWEEVIDVQQKILKSKLSEDDQKKENRNLLGYRYELGRHLFRTGAADRAIKTLKAVLKADKDFIAAYPALAEIYMQEGNTKEAREILLNGYRTTSSLVILVRLEEHYIAQGEPGAIIDLYQKQIQQNPRDLKLQLLLAKLYYRLEMIDHAFETMNNIDTSAFDFSHLHTLFGSIYERRSEYEKAIDEFKKALKVEKPLLVPFCCSACGHTSRDWTGRCPECKSWNTLILDINEVCKAQKRHSSS